MESLESSEDRLPPCDISDLPTTVRRAAEAAGWQSLTPVQQKAVPYLIAKRDLIVQSRTGSGKTGAFLLPLFDLLDQSQKNAQALILTPTRELARQVDQEFNRMRPKDNGLRTALVYGGVKYGPQISALKDGAQLVVGTPGRVIDLLEQRHMSLDALQVFVMDEADEMLSMGFYPAMKALKKFLPQERNSFMFSATMPIRVQNLADEFLTEPGFLTLSAGAESVETSEHRYLVVPPMDRDRVLVSLIETENPDSAIIFANTKRDVEYLTAFLRNYGHDAAEISGDLSQKAREAVMKRLKEGELRFLVATDVAARGIDVSDLGYVFMYDVPDNHEYYIHRSGRTARAGNTGTVIVLATMLNHNTLKGVAKRYGVILEKQEAPTEEQVNAIVSERMTVLLEDAYRTTNREQRSVLQQYIPLVKQIASDAPHLLTMLVDDFYHQQMHRKRDRSIADNLPDPRPDETTEMLQSSYDSRPKMGRERAERFLPMTKELVEEEPELLAMLVASFQLSPTEKQDRSRPRPKAKQSRGGSGKSGSRSRGGSGGGRENRRR